MFDVYNPAVDNFGERVKQLRALRRLGQRQMARIALGEDATTDDVQYYADQLSKLESGTEGNTNPTLQRIWAVARGFGFNDIDAFFAELKRVPALINSQGRKDLSASAVEPDNPALPQAGDHGDQFSNTNEVTVFDFIEATSKQIGEHLGKVTDAINGLSTAVGNIGNKLDAVLARVGSDDRRVPKASARQANRRTRAHDRVHKTG